MQVSSQTCSVIGAVVVVVMMVMMMMMMVVVVVVMVVESNCVMRLSTTGRVEGDSRHCER